MTYGVWGRAAAAAILLLLPSCGSSPNAELEKKVLASIDGMKIPDKAGLPALNLEMLRALAPDVPGLDAKLAELEKREKANLAAATAGMEELQQERWPEEVPGEKHTGGAQKQALIFSTDPTFNPADWIAPPAYALDASSVQAAVSGVSSGLLLGGIVGRGSDGKKGSDSREFKGNNGEKAVVTIDAEADGTVSASLESNVDVPELGIISGAKTSITAKTLCPDVNGHVEFTVKQTQSAGASGAAQSGTIEAKVEISVGENAQITLTNIKTKYDRKSSGKGGSTSVSGNADWTVLSTNSVELKDYKQGTASGKDAAALEAKAAAAAVALGIGASQGAESYWRNGNCIRIEAKEPYRPDPNEKSDIPVAVFHKQDGAQVAARVDAKLSGGASLDPVVIRRTPGNLLHTAPNGRGISMTLELTAKSKRGQAFERYQFTTAGLGYQIEGGGGEFKGVGSTCDLTQEFKVFGNANIEVTFTPSSKDGGSYSYTGQIAGSRLFGKGTYTVKYDGETAVSIDAQGPGTATSPYGSFTRPGKEHYVLTPSKCDG